jgi:hypothetical protein
VIEAAEGATGKVAQGSRMVLIGLLTGSGKMQVEGLMEWRIYGKMEGQGETVVVSGGQMKVGSSGYYVTLRRKLTNEGSVVLEAGTLYLGQNGLLQNKGTFEVKDGTYISLTDSQPGLFVNEGTLRKGEGDGTAYVYAKVENKGTIEVLAGKISFGSKRSFGHDGWFSNQDQRKRIFGDWCGVIEAAEGATGKVAQGSRMVLIGLLTGSGKMQVEGLMEWRQSGKMEGQGETVVVSGGQMKVGSSGYYVTLRRKLTNEGSVVFEAGYLYLGQNGLLQNKGTFEVKDGTGIYLTDSQPGLFVNEGTLRKGEGNGTAYVYAKVENKGTIEVLSGKISVGNGTRGHLVMMDGSQIKTNESGYLEIGYYGVIEAAEGATGKVAQGSRMVLIGTLTGSGKMQVEGLMEWRQYGKMEGQGETVVVSGGQMKVGSSGYYVTLRRKLTNEGSVVLEADYLVLGQNGLLQNKGTFEVKDNTVISLTDSQPGLFVNEGTLRKGEGNGTAYVYAKVENKGTIEVLSGKISVGNGTRGHLVMMDGSQIKTNESGYLEIGYYGVIEAAEGATGKVAQGSRMVLIGTLTGSGKMQVEGLMEWRQYGKMEGQGETVVVSGGQMKDRKQWLLCDFEAEVDQRRECGFGGGDFVFGTERFASKQGNF